jgi:UDP-N-acetylglucosamine:LPS N-acetylglucosamine transferase
VKVAYYVSGHGFGHISRSFELIKVLLAHPEILEVHLISTRNSFVKERHSKLFFREAKTDVGMVQNNSISIDVLKTLEELEGFIKNKPTIIESELRYLRHHKIDRIISDSSSLPFLLATKLNIPSFFVGNFTWSSIYSHYSGYDKKFLEHANILSEEYFFARAGLILAFSMPIDCISNQIPVGVVGRKPNLPKAELRKRFGMREDTTYFLLSFGAYGLEDTKIEFEKLPSSYVPVVSGHEGFFSSQVMRISDDNYPNVVCASDYVLTKPGYGILSECYYANTPIVYTDRGDFPEYPYLVQALDTYFESYYITQSQLSSMNFWNSLSVNRRPTNPLPDANYDLIFTVL